MKISRLKPLELLFVALLMYGCDEGTQFSGSFSGTKEAPPEAQESSNASTESDGGGEAEESTQAASGKPVEINSEEELSKACQDESVVTEYIQEIVFPEPTETCQWGEPGVPADGNLSPENGTLTARLEQVEYLKLPENALLCGLELDFLDTNSDADPDPDASGPRDRGGSTLGQEMYYDDEIFLTVNDVILVASQSYSDRLKSIDGFLQYKWSNLVGTPYSQNYGPYCVGAETKEGSCTVPKTQTQGVIEMTIDDGLVRRVGLAAGVGFDVGDSAKGPVESGLDDFRFKFITLGDNDDPLDCKHSTFKLTVKSNYIIRK